MTLYNRNVRQDVRELGELLGEVLEEQTSAAAMDAVEKCRTSAIAYRAGDIDTRDPIREALASDPVDHQQTVARAFTTYFELINLVEERERIRSIRRDSQDGTLDGDLESAAAQLAELDPETAQLILDETLIEPTFTAHPTEAHRKTIKAKLREIASDLETLDERLLTDKETGQVWRDLRAEVTSLWQTAQVRDHKPAPEDEARNVQWYLENTLFDVVPEVYDELETALDEGLDAPVDIPKLFEFRSWAGSDRDGNPYVTPEVTTATLQRQRRVVLQRYAEELESLLGALSQKAAQLSAGSAFESTLEAALDEFPGRTQEIRERYSGEPYRQQLALMRARIERVDDVRPGGYADAEAFRRDIERLEESLRTTGAETVAAAHVRPLRRQVETFGFSLAGLDLRDHQQNHTETLVEALAREGIEYGSFDEAERVEFLTDAILQDEPVIDLGDTTGLSETAARVQTRFDRLADWQDQYGAEAIDTYCISMTEEPSHVMEVLFLADQAGVVSLPEHCGLDVVPLLETEYALSGARRIMGTLFENEAYAAALDARDGVQEIMLGYSDSNKENGFLAANWSLYRNQKRLADICEAHGVTMRLFHGRGGSISRGGGPMNEAMLALPNSTVTGQIKFTEQGEAIAEKYSNPRIAERNIEQMVNAQLRARQRSLESPREEVPEDWRSAMETMATAAREEYRDLLDTDGFVQYFEQATPITVIEDLNLGSRPASRSDERTVADLRAIPWVFSWTQSRCIMTSWYGLATGIETYLDDGGSLETLQTMYDEWPFFRTTLDNAALSVARTDLEIAAEYAALASSDLRERFFPRLSAECERAGDIIKRISQRDTLHTRDWLGENLDRRNPYVDPLNLLQVRLLGQEDRDEGEERTLRLTVKGIAAGMKNTG